ncbi:MAG: bifunctional phosphopantothenoylcysteine decarboxylase/phosphopantothenate--cysteine ligase CoaBC [Clostridia bacterium]|nr:bifunctional phosphopantothenoylcysteine decarboxylase/phosphopantothenate--cysteine ligase CoaBC [Clostridia bacterium]
MNIVLGVTGSIAAFKAAELTSKLCKAGHNVHVILTKNGSEFVTPLTFETLSKNAVACDMFRRERPFEVEHISLAKLADVFVVAPATANFISKYAMGIADDMLTTTVLATRAPVIIAPAMNTAMYEHAAVQENMRILRDRGVYFCEPETGVLACGDTGKGRMQEPALICEMIEKILTEQDYAGKRVLITAGATREDIDPVRFLTNRSTGTMGVSLANAAAMRGASVTLVAGAVQARISDDVKVVSVRSTADMYEAVSKHADEADIVICAAAPADFTPREKSSIKIKKGDKDDLCISLMHTRDILKGIADKKGERLHIGFAAETNDIEQNAKRKLTEKNLDAIAANDVSDESSGFGLGKNAVTLYMKDGRRYESGPMEKPTLANWLLDRIKEIWQ